MMRGADARDDTQPARPWYRHLWPWLLMLPPIASVCGGVTMIWLATHTPASLAVADYAQIEEITAARFAADAQAARDGRSAQLRIDRANAEQTRITVRLNEPDDTAAQSLQLSFRHATNAALDRVITARRIGLEFAADTDLAFGNFLVEIEPPDGAWRLAARLRPGDQRIELVASGAAQSLTTDAMAPQ